MQRRFQLMGYVGGKLLPDLRILFQRLLVPAELSLLGSHAAQQRLNLRIFLPPHVLHRLIQVDVVDRLNDGFGNPRGQHKGEYKRDQNHHADRLRKPQHQDPNRILRHRKPDHRAVRQPLRTVKVLLRYRIGISAAFAITTLQRLLHLFPFQMVFHLSRIRFIIIQHRTVRGNPGHAVFPGIQTAKILHPVQGNTLRRQLCPDAQLFLLYPRKIAVQRPHDKHK